jgi:hypothetical protein
MGFPHLVQFTKNVIILIVPTLVKVFHYVDIAKHGLLKVGVWGVEAVRKETDSLFAKRGKCDSIGA